MKPSFLIIIITWGLNPILTRIGSNLTDPRAYMILFSLINTSSLLIINSAIDNNVWSKIRLFNTFKPIIIVVVDGVICMAIPAYLYNILVLYYLLHHYHHLKKIFLLFYLDQRLFLQCYFHEETKFY